MNKLSRPTRDSLVPLSIVELKPAKRPGNGFATLTDLLHMADGVMLGRITRNHLFRIEREPAKETYFTTISLEGKSLGFPNPGQPTAMDISFNAGSIQANLGIHNPNAPSIEEVRQGTQVVVFYRWMSDLGCGIRGNGLVGLKAGLFVTRQRRGQTWIQGRGAGYGVPEELPLCELSGRIASIEELRGPSKSSA